MSQREVEQKPDPFLECMCAGQCGRLHADGHCLRPAQKDQHGAHRKIGASFLPFCRHCAENFDKRAAELPGIQYDPSPTYLCT